MREPRRDHYLAPATGEDTERVLEEAIKNLGTLRNLPSLGDPGTTLHLLTSLIAQAEQRLPRAVADARNQDYSWAQIGDLLGTPRASAWQHYNNRPDNTTSTPSCSAKDAERSHRVRPESADPVWTRFAPLLSRRRVGRLDHREDEEDRRHVQSEADGDPR